MSDLRKRYTPEDDAILRTMAARGDSAHDIARQLDRGYWSLRARARYLNVEIQPQGRRATAETGSTYLSDYSVDWRAVTWDRLAWSYGADRADRIQSGKDPSAQMDLARWHALGRRSAA